MTKGDLPMIFKMDQMLSFVFAKGPQWMLKNDKDPSRADAKTDNQPTIFLLTNSNAFPTRGLQGQMKHLQLYTINANTLLEDNNKLRNSLFDEGWG